MRLAGVPKAERRARVEQLLTAVHLDGFAKKRPHQLSGGMRQRGALARAFAQDADILLMDEPFGALDAMTRDALHDELDTLVRARGLTVLFVTHNVREAARLGDRIVVMSPRPGRVTASFDVPIERPAAHRLARGQRARGHRDRPAPGGGARPCSSLNPTHRRRRRPPTRASTTAPPSPTPTVPRRDRAELGRRIWLATWPKVAAIALALLLWQIVVWSRVAAGVRAAGTGDGVRPARRADRRRHGRRGRRRDDAAGASSGSPSPSPSASSSAASWRRRRSPARRSAR